MPERRKVAAFTAALMFALASCDTVRVGNVIGQAGVLADGATNGGTPVNDRRGTRGGSGSVEVMVGRLTSANSPNRNEAVAFGSLKSPRRADMRWTSSNSDRMSMTLGDSIPFNMTFWIVQGPYRAQFDHAFLACLKTAAVLVYERTGLRLNHCDIRDATQDPDITNAILNSTGGDSRNWNDFSTAIGLTANQVNVYWINTVESSTTTGWSDFGQRIVMGKDTGIELLVHELGHSLSLQHPVGCNTASTDFDVTNIMWQCSSTREFVTEGQVFRMHFDTESAVNDVYAARPGQPTETCPATAQSLTCPGLHRRLWADGTFQPN